MWTGSQLAGGEVKSRGVFCAILGLVWPPPLGRVVARMQGQVIQPDGRGSLGLERFRPSRSGICAEGESVVPHDDRVVPSLQRGCNIAPNAVKSLAVNHAALAAVLVMAVVTADPGKTV